MRAQIAFVLAAAVSLGGAQMAAAADMPAPVLKAAPSIAPVNWTGFYGGLNAGWVGSTGRNISNNGSDTAGGGLGTGLAAGAIPGSLDLGYNGFIGGGQLGYNWQVNNWVFGLEADIDGASAKADSTIGPITVGGFVPQTTTYHRELDWLATFRGRVGITATPALLLYATGGLAVGQTKIGNSYICPTCIPPASSQAGTTNTSSNTSAGWTAGAGIEWMFAPNWSLKAEYLYVDLGSHDSTITYSYGPNTSSLTSSVHDRMNIARGGINYHF